MSLLEWMIQRVRRLRLLPPRSAIITSQPMRKLTAHDAIHIEKAFEALAHVGLITSDREVQPGDVAQRIATEWAGVSFSHEPHTGHWCLMALSSQPSVFTNALYCQDHCFDVATQADVTDLISEIVGLARPDWLVEAVEVRNASGAASPAQLGDTHAVHVKTRDGPTSFNIVHEKDFDWSLIPLLNERLPVNVTKRFAILLDGNAHIVFLTPEQICKLNALSGFDFVCG